MLPLPQVVVHALHNMEFHAGLRANMGVEWVSMGKGQHVVDYIGQAQAQSDRTIGRMDGHVGQTFDNLAYDLCIVHYAPKNPHICYTMGKNYVNLPMRAYSSKIYLQFSKSYTKIQWVF